MTDASPNEEEEDEDEAPASQPSDEPEERPQPRNWLEKLAARKPTLLFFLAFLFLNVFVNVRFPGSEPKFWYVIPSIDVLVVFVYLAWFGRLKWRVPRAAVVSLVAFLMFVRLVRLGDGIQHRVFATRFNFYTDLPVFPELLRFLHSSLGLAGFLAAALGSLLALAALSLACYGALRHAEAYLTNLRHVGVALALTALGFFGAQSFRQRADHDALFFWRGLGASIMPRLEQEARFLFNIYNSEAKFSQSILTVQQKLERIPNDLEKLGGASVHLILVESYGQCVFDLREHADYLKPTFDRFEAELGRKGFSIVTGILNSSTYGGQSWLAHATLGTGIRVHDQLEYELVLAKKPRTIASFFRAAGYRTVLVAPGTSRPWPKGDFYGFEQKYYGWEFGYAGPWFAWARMPDQYVLDFVRRKELASRDSRPLFIQYQLISSHAPWSDLPPLIRDWDSLGDGSLFKRVRRVRYPIKWPNFENASRAYAHSIKYDFQVLEQFIGRYIHDGSLIVILGDHQPVSDVNGHSDALGVPVHLLSRNPDLLQPFRALGYTPGLRKVARGAYAGLETFLPDLLARLSTRRRD